MVQKLVLLLTGVFLLFLASTLSSVVTWTTSLFSLAIVLGGSVLGVLIAFPLSTLSDLVYSLKRLYKQELRDIGSTIRNIELLARIARTKGLKALETEAAKIQDPSLKAGLDLVVDQYERFEVRDILEKEFEFQHFRLGSQQAVLDTMVKLAPAFGFVGTIMGLINVLGNVSSPDEMAKAMSLALLTTFYGLLMSNILFLPLSRKFAEYVKAEHHAISIIIEGLSGIAALENSKSITHRLHLLAADGRRARGDAGTVISIKSPQSQVVSTGRPNA